MYVCISTINIISGICHINLLRDEVRNGIEKLCECEYVCALIQYCWKFLSISPLLSFGNFYPSNSTDSHEDGNI